MGQDYVARKAAKKQRKRSARDAETGRKNKRKRKADGLEIVGEDEGLSLTVEQQKRKRKKGNNVSLRISRSLCYKEPQLTEEDKAWNDWEDGDNKPSGVPSLDGFVQSGYDSDVEEQLKKLPPQQQQQQKTKPKQQQQSKPKLSTAIGLLNPATAAKQSSDRAEQRKQRQQQHQQLDDVIAGAPALKTLADTVNPFLARCMAKLGFLEPTPIQSAAWPAAVAGKDLQGVAEPGSGKTLAYLLPAVSKIAAAAAAAGPTPEAAAAAAGNSSSAAVQPQVLIIAPSRELAQQVHQQCVAIASVTAAPSFCVFGGVPKEQQIEQLQQRQPCVLVATPGRLLDLVSDSIIDLALVSCVVLDEADKMLSVGFEPQLQVLKGLLIDSRSGRSQLPASSGGTATPAAGGSKPKKRKQTEAAANGTSSKQQQRRPQVLLFTATLPAAVQATAAAWLAPDAVHVSCTADADSISRTITQVVHVCAEHKKPAKLIKHLATIKEASAGLRNPPRVLVFANKIKTVLFIQRTLAEAGYRTAMLHGKRSQAERTAAVADFKSGKAQVLVASDVASRGLDIRGLPYVVNYDFPSSLETYIHRVGRTGRLAAQGHAYSFFTRNLAKLAAPVVQLLQAHDQAVDPNLVALAEAWAQAEAALVAQGKTIPDPSGGAAESEQEEDETVDQPGSGAAGFTPEDLQEGLPQQQQQQQPAGQAAAAANKQQQSLVGKNSKKKMAKREGDMMMVPQVAAAAAAANEPGSSSGGSGSAVPDFVPAQRFVGAKAGMVFKKGSRGLGYYKDALQLAALSQHSQPQPKQQQRKAAAGKQQQQAKQQQQQKQKQQRPVKPELPPLPGLAKKRPAFLSSDLSDDDAGGVLDAPPPAAAAAAAAGSSDYDSDSDGGVASAGGGSLGARLARKEGGKKKALPGRLRKKLAKQKAAGKQS